MAIDPFSQYGVVSASPAPEKENAEKKPVLFTVLIVLILLFILFLSLYLLRTRTSFFNFASSLTEDTSTIDLPVSSTEPLTTTNTSTTSATTTEVSTSSAIIPIATAIPTPTTAPTSVAIENSYMFASPITAATGGVEKIRITIFILDGTGAGISGRAVTLTGTTLLAVYTIQGTTDTTGKAVFDVAAGTSGSYVIGATVGGVSLTQTVTVTFD